MISNSSISATCEDPLSSACRSDVLIHGRADGDCSWSVVIEAKIDALERKDQLRDLLRTAPGQLKFGIFLTPAGDAGSTGGDNWACLSYLQWAQSLIRMQQAVAHTPGAPFLRMYITGVLEDICGIVGGTTTEDVTRKNSPFELEKLLDP